MGAVARSTSCASASRPHGGSRRSRRRAIPSRAPLLALALALALPGSARPQAATARVLAAVIDAQGTPLAGIAVTLRGPGPERSATTDAQGRCGFPHLAPGAYSLAASAPGLEPQALDLEVGPGLGYEPTLVLWARCGPEPGCPKPEPPAPRSADDAWTFSRAELGARPHPSDPWAVLRDVPGVVVDRADVGGSETGFQSLLASRGDAGGGAVFTLDGADVTDPAALGFAAVFPDLDGLDALSVRTSALDVRVRTPGVQVGLALREPGNALAGGAHLRGSTQALQSDNLPGELAARPFPRARTERIVDAGLELGGAPHRDHLWLWGTASRHGLEQAAASGHDERITVTLLATKARLRLGAGALSLLALASEKVHEQRDPTPSAAPESRWRQSGVASLLALEDNRRLGRVWLVSRLSRLDGGFRLEPGGGAGPGAFEDLGGTFQRSFYAFATDRDRLQLGTEAAWRTRAFGRDHELLAGAGYRRQPVETRLSWPGNAAYGLERQSLFFRTFRLTGFATLTRNQDVRLVQDQAEAFVQDDVRLGRVRATLGLRLDRLSGHAGPSAVPANPAFPELLPPVAYGGGPERFRWLDLLPRAGVAWDMSGDGRSVARIAYAAYAGALGAGDVGFDDPLTPASVTYYWRDRDADHVVDPGELDLQRGQVAFSGLDPTRPAGAVSPNAIDPGLRAPRTHELLAASEQAFGPSLRAGVVLSLRRARHPLWRPLRGLTRADYAVSGSVSGELFGEPYDVPFYAPATESRIVPGNGRLLTNREGYRQDTVGLTVRLGGRIGGRVEWELRGGFTQWRERFEDPDVAVQDPTPLDVEPLVDAGPVAVRPGGLGRGDVFVNARWTAGASAAARLPWRVEAAIDLFAREGFPIPYIQVASSGDPTAGAKDVLVSGRLDAYRLPALALLDLRLARPFRLGRGMLRAVADAFNLLDRATELQQARDVELPAFGRARELVRPRILRLGLEYAF